MSYCTHRIFFASLFLLLAILASFADTADPKPTPKQIAQWVEQLGDNDFKARESASKNLWQAGAAAEAALEKALASDDPEVVRRARDLLQKFRWGIYPDTPADIVALIGAYRSSAGRPRLEVVEKLLEGGVAGLRAALKIAAAEKDMNQRKELGEWVAHKLPVAFYLAVTEGKYEPCERLLEFGHEGKLLDHHEYAAYWLLRGQLPQRIAHFRARLNEHPQDKWLAQTLAYLHRAGGNLLEARKAAEKSDRPDLLEGILYELGDWKALAERPDSSATEKPADTGIYHATVTGNPAEKWAYRAAFARLAGKQKDFENAVRELRKCVEDKHERDSLTFVAAKGLLLNDRPADGLELLRSVPDQRALLFDILCARHEFAAALDLAVKEVEHGKEIPSLDLARARLLHLLGEKEGETLFDRSAERIKDGVDPEWVQKLLKEEMNAGLKDRAFAHAAKALSVAGPARAGPSNETRLWLYFEQLFPRQSTTAGLWWHMLRRQFPDESTTAVLKRLRELMEGKAAAKDVKSCVERAEDFLHSGNVKLFSWPPPEAWEPAVAEAALRAGLHDVAVSVLEKADSRDALLRLGDLLAAKKQWMNAAERYQQAWKKQLSPKHPAAIPMALEATASREAHDPLPLYLAGDALVRAGQETQGKKLIEQAHALPFTHAEARHKFINDLNQRGHKEAARREIDWMLRVSEPNSFYANDAFQRFAVAARARKDYPQTAEGAEKQMLYCLRPGVIYTSNANYVREPARIHSYRAMGLLAAGKIDEAIQHAERALLDYPGFSDLIITLVPELERRGRKKDADALFGRCYGVYEKVCRVYPRCAEMYNTAAWMSACCRRNLDQALQHAQKAVELAPANAGYLDTLAEVHFQRGDKDKAVALQKRVIELDPKRPYFRKQLKRLEAGDPSAERPPENDEE